MARVHESSFVTTLHELEAMERERAQSEERAREAERAEQRLRERRLALDRQDAERRQRWAEQDRQRALVREGEQHEARLRAIHQATLDRARLEVEGRAERERLSAIHDHALRMAELEAGVRVRRWRAAAAVLAALCALFASAGAVLTVRLRAETDALREQVALGDRARTQLAAARREVERAEQRGRVGEAKVALLRTELDAARAEPAPREPKTPAGVALSRPRRPGARAVNKEPCRAGGNGDPLNGCIP